MRVTFDRPLTANPALNTANWYIRIAGMGYVTSAATASGHHVTLTGNPSVPDPGPNIINYAPPPFDLIGAHAVAVAAFSNFPIT